VKTYELILKPLSGFGTPLKGDTIFGQFCWQILEYQSKIGKNLDQLLIKYDREPFIVFSSAIPRYKSNGRYYYVFKAPTMPKFLMGIEDKEKIEDRQKKKNKIGKKEELFLIIPEGEKFPNINMLELKHINFDEIETSDEAYRFKNKIELRHTQWHNKINRLVGRTIEDRFAPFSEEQIVYHPGIQLSIFMSLQEDVISFQQVQDIFAAMGEFGFGRDASTGLGKFKIIDCKEVNLFAMGSDSYNACYTLGPCVPEKNTINKTKSYFSTFVRYGRHGNSLAKSSNPFKNPVIMMLEGAVITPLSTESFKIPYIGKAIFNVSKAEPKTVVQGYSLYIPVNLEAN